MVLFGFYLVKKLLEIGEKLGLKVRMSDESSLYADDVNPCL